MDQPSAPVREPNEPVAAMAPMVQPASPITPEPPMGRASVDIGAAAVPRPTVRLAWVPSHGVASAASGPTVAAAASTPTVVARRQVQTSISGGRFPGGIREAVRGHLQPFMRAITRCANRGQPAEGEGAEDAWFMDFEFTLSPQGRVRSVEPHGSTTISKPEVTACMRSALFDQQLADEPAPESIQVGFTNRYN